MAELDDDAVAELLRAAMADDVVPDAVLVEAELIAHTVDLDAELATLLESSALVRADDATAVYSVDDVHVAITPEVGGIVVEIVGIVGGTVELVAGPDTIHARPDGSRFRIATTHVGPARVKVTADGRTVVTEWFTLV